jgi:3-hydroxybutyryl-CoA dehydrogenase
MGAAIASLFTATGHRVTVLEVDATRRASLADLIQSQINDIDALTPSVSAEVVRVPVTLATDLHEAVASADVVIESVTEDRSVKESVWEAIGVSAPATAILATNTSSLSVTELAGVVPGPSRVLGIHFFNPAHILPGVEVVLTANTDPRVVDAVVNLLHGAGKHPVMVKDTPGFVVNRLQFVLIAEAMRLIDEGVATPEDIDTLVETTIGPRWLAGGPMISADAAGLDVYVSILRELQDKLGDHYQPPDIITGLVSEGRLGAKTGSGLIGGTADFYATSQVSRFEKLRRILRALRGDTDSAP